MRKSPVAVVREGLQAFTDRQIFRNFTEASGKNGTIRFTFLYLTDRPMTIEFTPRAHALVIRDMLPRVPLGLYADLQEFLATLSDPNLPPYRRIDKRSADARLIRKRGHVSLEFQVRRNRYTYGVEKLVNLASWIRTYLQARHQVYLWDVMGEPQD
jgi:hypothetical protein